MTNVTIFGSGNMGTAIDKVLSEGGASVDHIGSSDTNKTVTGDIVILAVYHTAVEEILNRYSDQLAGKIVVDITNPVNLETFDSLVVPAHSSNAAELAGALPASRVLKAFNTTFAPTLTAKSIGPNKTTVLVAGDDAEAKSALIDAITAGGVDAFDAGSLSRARELESLGLLQMTLAGAGKIGWTGGFALVS
jgi:8-hydroxy-5-deazaflavin:NADPH oxidoreductase